MSLFVYVFTVSLFNKTRSLRGGNVCLCFSVYTVHSTGLPNKHQVREWTTNQTHHPGPPIWQRGPQPCFTRILECTTVSRLARVTKFLIISEFGSREGFIWRKQFHHEAPQISASECVCWCWQGSGLYRMVASACAELGLGDTGSWTSIQWHLFCIWTQNTTI